MTAKPGDAVKIITSDEEYEGILLPRPEILEEGITVLKLENGYNIGIKEKNIKKISLVKKNIMKKVINKRLRIISNCSFISKVISGVYTKSLIYLRKKQIYSFSTTLKSLILNVKSLILNPFS